MNQLFLSRLALISIFLCSCADVKKEKLAVEKPLEEKAIVVSEVEKVPEIKQIQIPKIDTLSIEGRLIKVYQAEIDEETSILVDVDGEEMEFNYPTIDRGDSLLAVANNKVQVSYYDKVDFNEFDITIDGASIHEESEFEPTEDAPYKWSKVEGVLAANTLSNGVPKPITITSKDGVQTIINSYVHQSHLNNNGKVVTAYYGEEQQHNVISISVIEQVTKKSPFLGVWGTGSPIVIAEGGEEGYYMYFGQDAGFVKADINKDTIAGTNFTGKFTIKLISTDPPQMLYSDDGRGHFEPIVDQLYEKVVSNNAKLLIGKWQSLDDSKSVIEYTAYDELSYHDGKLIVKEPYCLSPKCMNSAEVDLPPSSKHDYISLIDSDMCYNIVSLDENNLTLSFMGRGNSLKYKRVK